MFKFISFRPTIRSGIRIDSIIFKPEGKMNINATAAVNLTESISKMNEVLKSAVGANMELSDKMMKANIVSSIEGLGENIDIKL